jgi:hypothetical protein
MSGQSSFDKFQRRLMTHHYHQDSRHIDAAKFHKNSAISLYEMYKTTEHDTILTLKFHAEM